MLSAINSTAVGQTMLTILAMVDIQPVRWPCSLSHSASTSLYCRMRERQRIAQVHLQQLISVHAGHLPELCAPSMLTHTHPFNGPFPGLPRWAGTRKVKPIWILLKQETVSGSGIRWAICKSAPSSRQITTPAPHHSVFYRPDALPAAEPTNTVKALKALTVKQKLPGKKSSP